MFSLETPRLVLRDWSESDLPLVRALCSDPQVRRNQRLLACDEVGARAWLEKALRSGSEDPRAIYNLVVERKADSRGLGWIGMGTTPDPEMAAIGLEANCSYALLSQYRGRGYMSEALRSVLSFGFGSLGVELIGAYCEIANTASARVMERAGMRSAARRGHVLYFLASAHHKPSQDPRDALGRGDGADGIGVAA
ncbi:MAG: GNAT family N-acetyltransferase [Gaiellaceae bacterium]